MSEALCVGYGYLTLDFTLNSYFLLIPTAVDRYLSIVQPLSKYANSNMFAKRFSLAIASGTFIYGIPEIAFSTRIYEIHQHHSKFDLLRNAMPA